MNKNVVTFLITIGFLFVGNSVFSKVVMDDIKLPEPIMTGSMPLMEALQNRKNPIKTAKIIGSASTLLLRIKGL